MPVEYFLDHKPRVEKPTNEQEPRVITEDVANILRGIIRPDDDDSGSSVSLVASRADTSARTVYRVLSESTKTISLDLADRLCVAADSHLAVCRLQMPDGSISGYFGDEIGIIPL